MQLFLWVLLLNVCLSLGYKIPKMGGHLNLNHLDKENLERLERMFYLKNSRYNPMRNRIFYKYKITNETENASPQELNITNVLERINDEFIKKLQRNDR